MVERFCVRLHAYVLMDNHYYLLVKLTELNLNLSRTGQWLDGSYSTWFNRRHGRSGPLFQGRFKAVIVDAVEWWLALSRYGDSGRDLVLYLGRRECGLTLTELAQAIGLEGYKAAATAIRRYEGRLPASQAERALLKRVRSKRK